MPVIRGQSRQQISRGDREKLKQSLIDEYMGNGIYAGPVIYEIPLEEGESTDVLVVWDKWQNVGSSDRSEIIRDACHDVEPNMKISLALGVTYAEAIEQRLLLYSVLPMVKRGEVDREKLTEAMMSLGGFRLENGKIDLRFPTMELAEQAHRTLVDNIPNGYWSIVQELGPYNFDEVNR
ncbi:hypothetical protein [Lacunimicrobium album]